MTVEHRVLYALSDIAAVVFLCRRKDCGTRLSLTPDTVSAAPPLACPRCEAIWLSDNDNNLRVPFDPAMKLVLAISDAYKAASKERGVDVLLEFVEPTR